MEKESGAPCLVPGNVNWRRSCCGKRDGSSSNTETQNYHVIQPGRFWVQTPKN